MAVAKGDMELSPLSSQYSEDQLTVDVMIYKIPGNDGWTLEVGLDDETSVAWTDLFPTDQLAWDEFSSAVADLGLRKLIDADGEDATIH